jgi:hypothetical protein
MASAINHLRWLGLLRRKAATVQWAHPYEIIALKRQKKRALLRPVLAELCI